MISYESNKTCDTIANYIFQNFICLSFQIKNQWMKVSMLINDERE